MPRGVHRGELQGNKPKPKPKDKNTIPEVPSVEDVIQKFHSFKQVTCSRGFHTTVSKDGSVGLIHTRANGVTLVAVKAKIVSAMGQRVIVKINLDFPDFTTLQLIIGNCKPLDEIFSMNYEVIKSSQFKELWDQKYDARRFAEG